MMSMTLQDQSEQQRDLLKEIGVEAILPGIEVGVKALAHLQRPYYEPGTQQSMEVTVENRRLHAPVKVVKLPFYEPEWKKK